MGKRENIGIGNWGFKTATEYLIFSFPMPDFKQEVCHVILVNHYFAGQCHRDCNHGPQHRWSDILTDAAGDTHKLKRRTEENPSWWEAVGEVFSSFPRFPWECENPPLNKNPG